MSRKLLLLFFLLLLPVCALAETAEDITHECLINNREWNKFSPNNLCDSSYNSYYQGQTVTIQAPEGKTVGALVIKWRIVPTSDVLVLTQDSGNWAEIYRERTDFAQQLIRLDKPVSSVRIKLSSGKLDITELTMLTEGELPANIPNWRACPDKVDLMLFSTHPDDEVLWFGGLLPKYAGEEKKDVLVVNAVYGFYMRRQELLDALWTCGVDIYPVFCGFADNNDPPAQLLRKWMGKDVHPQDGPVELIRRYKPDVVVLHDENGEYGHNAHILFSSLGRQGVERAADPAEHPASAEQYGVWDTPKTYIHLYSENQIYMDWQQSLSAFDGKTGLDVAKEAFLCHVSQVNKKYWRVEAGGPYDNALFGLWRTTVGPDVEKNDFFENIP